MPFKPQFVLSMAILAVSGLPVFAQTSPAFNGYVPSGALGMSGSVVPGTAGAPVSQAQVRPRPVAGQGGLPALADGNELSAQRIEGFNTAVENTFPMTPDMVRQYRQIFDEQQRAMLERPEPSAVIDAGLITLEPGETPGRIHLAPGIASVIGFYDATGQAWPIDQYVVGNGENFQVLALGDDSNNLVLTPLGRLGWTNIVIQLRDEPKPVVLRVEVSEQSAHFRHDIQIARNGPNAAVNTAVPTRSVTEAGSRMLLSVLTRTDLPPGAARAPVSNVQAEAWQIGDNLYVRSRHALLSPAWSASMAGPDQVRVYEIPPSNALLFSIDGRVIRAGVELP